jgi:hypothetical protein
MEEIWKPVVGYESCYEVSNLGRIKSLDRKVKSKNNSISNIKGKFVIYHKRGEYLSYDLSKNGIKKTISIHRLVAQAFIPNPENKPQVNHKDANKLNNNLSNLEWVTRKENSEHASLNNLMPIGEKNYHNKIKEKDVLFIRKSLKLKTLTPRKLADMFYVNINHIYNIRDIKSWKYLK